MRDVLFCLPHKYRGKKSGSVEEKLFIQEKAIGNKKILRADGG
jgi:hypothetical protein